MWQRTRILPAPPSAELIQIVHWTTAIAIMFCLLGNVQFLGKIVMGEGPPEVQDNLYHELRKEK